PAHPRSPAGRSSATSRSPRGASPAAASRSRPTTMSRSSRARRARGGCPAARNVQRRPPRPCSCPRRPYWCPSRTGRLLAKAWAPLHHLPIPDPLPCGDNCGVSINWPLFTDYRGGWSARITLFNWDEVSFADWSRRSSWGGRGPVQGGVLVQRDDDGGGG
ncbi:cobra-like protein 7, partial [Phtheirospermum japonicum]